MHKAVLFTGQPGWALMLAVAVGTWFCAAAVAPPIASANPRASSALKDAAQRAPKRPEGAGEASPHTGPSVVCRGFLVQGGVAICEAPPSSHVRIGDALTTANEDGVFVVGFDRDAPLSETIRVRRPDGVHHRATLKIAKREFSTSRIDGLPPSQVNKFSKAQRARIESSSARKRTGDASRAPISLYRERFSWPLAGKKTTSFGAQRILNGIPKRPHYGVDLSAPTGTSIVAPAGGVITLADNDLYFEGAMIVIDHGEGFLSKYLHVSRIDVHVGQRVTRGDVIGAVGSRGRSTGPHLCWRLKWRDRNLDPELWISSAAAPSPAGQ